MSISETVKIYLASLKEIQNYFGGYSIYSIEDWTDKYWCPYPSGDLGFDEAEFGGDSRREPNYSETIRIGPLDGGEYTACQIHDCFGDIYWVLLDNKMKREVE